MERIEMENRDEQDEKKRWTDRKNCRDEAALNYHKVYLDKCKEELKKVKNI